MSDGVGGFVVGAITTIIAINAMGVTYHPGFVAGCHEASHVVVYADSRWQCVTEQRRAELETALHRKLEAR